MKSKSLACLNLIALVAFLVPAAHAQTYSVIHTFNGADGSNPRAGVTIRGGILYGTTTITSNGHGSVYQLIHAGDNWGSIPIYIFPSLGNPNTPTARVVFGPDGHLYGTASQGGANNAGAIFNLTPPLSICRAVNCFWTELILHQFRGNFTDTGSPGYGDLVWDSQGNIYGTAYDGNMRMSYGAVYEMSPNGNGWFETPIYFFKGPPDASAGGGVIFDTVGNLFGAGGGGLNNDGSIYEVGYQPGVGWIEILLYSFTGGSDGSFPSGVTFDNKGNLFGATTIGGAGNGGTIFELSPSGDTWTFKLLYSFTAVGNCGSYGPARQLTLDVAGNIYGTTACDGAFGFGNVFKLTKNGANWDYTSLYDFTGGADGGIPISNVTIDTDGTLYGTAFQGGNQNSDGVVWMIKP